MIEKKIIDALYDMGAGELPTIEELTEQLKTAKGVAYIMESLVQFLDGTLPADQTKEIHAATMEIIRLIETED